MDKDFLKAVFIGVKKLFSGHIEKYYSSRTEIILLALALFYMMMAAA